MKGRRPLPPHLKVITGTARGADKKAKPPKKATIPPCPNHLSDIARDLWAEIAPQLASMGILTSSDAMGLELLCEAIADGRRARLALAANGGNYYTTKTESGSTLHRVHPAVADMRDADRRVRSWLSEYCLTPSARTRLQMDPPTDDDPANEYF